MQMDDLFDLSWCKYHYTNFILIAMHRLLLKKETCIKNKTDKKGNAMWFSDWIVIVTIWKKICQCLNLMWKWRSTAET